MTDLLLALAHHLLVFTIAAVLAAELALLGRPLSAPALRRVAALDAAYGISAALVLVIGFGRVFQGAKGAAFYLHNPVFWAKLGCFALVGLVSILPTVRFLQWKRQLQADAGFMPAEAEVSRVRRLLRAELALFVPIPLLAAAMARGYGYA